MSEFTIRPARQEELARVGELTLSAFRADNDNHYAHNLANAEARSREAELLVATDADGAVLGTVTIAQPGSPWTEVAKGDELEFRMLAVAPEARGRGIGEALTRRVLERATELGLRAVVLSSSRDMVAAHRLYERLGFHRTPEADWKVRETIELITYRLDLPRAS